MTLRPMIFAAFASLAGPALVLSAFVLPGQAQVAPATVPQTVSPAVAARLAAFSETLQIGRVMEVMRNEGLDYGTSLRDELFPATDAASWQRTVAQVYDAGAMRAGFDAVMARELAGDEPALAQMEAFFGSAIGQRIVTLEIDARSAMLDKAIEEAAKVTAQQLRADRDPLIARIERFAAAGDLIEMNVAGALTSNLAFYKGLAAEGGLAQGMTEEQMLADVWGQEADIRTETESWLMPYLALAYKPLTPADLDAYIAFSESPVGQKMNAAMFAAFDKVFTRISLDLGRAAARQIQGSDI